ncbi:MAG: SWIM zinc finger family protein, partial [Acutalibacteraceae bacterium]
VPLGERKCTCPSRSVCRHIITSILWLKNNLSDNINSDSDDNQQSEATTDENTDVKIPDELTNELSLFPLQAIQKAMKKQYYSDFVYDAGKGILPEIEETSVLAVKFPKEDITVRLISPLEYSTCTCHSRELCRHKAAAILAWQLKHKIITPELMLTYIEPTNRVDVRKVHSAAETVRNFLFDMLSNGLVRLSDDISDRAEYASAMCHNARLADCERLMREIGNRLQSYIDHTADFNTDILFSVIMDCITLLEKILKTDDQKLLSSYLGEFKSSYSLTDTLELIPVAKRHFSSASGYEGTLYYFLNKDKNGHYPFLSYSYIMPKYYVSSRHNKRYSAPWGLYGEMDDIMGCELRLENPKLSGNKISSSNDTKAEMLEKVNLNQPIVYDRIYTDFEKMLYEVFKNEMFSDIEKLVLVAPKRCVSSKSDTITQSHRIVIEDYCGHYITLKTKYKSDSKDFFALLQQVGDTMQENPEQQYVIFANTYIQNGHCYLYPIAIYDHIDIPKNMTAEKTEITYKPSETLSILSKLMYEIRSVLCDIIQCGINSFDLYEQVNDYSAECTKSGLIVLGGKLKSMYELFKAKNHTYNNDNTDIINILTEIYTYLSIGIQKTEIKQANNNLYEEN